MMTEEKYMLLGSREIHAFGDWDDNDEMFVDVAALGYLPEPVLDLTYNSGKFWNLYRPTRFTTNDLDPRFETDHHEDFRATKFGDGEFASVVFDPPYKLSGTNQLEEFDSQYGTTPVRSRTAIYGLIAGGIAEAARIATDFVLVKCQDQVSSGSLRMEATVAYDVARAMELTWADEFWLPGGGLPQDAERGQYHARHNRSVLMVFAAPKANNRRKKLLKEQYKSREL